MAVAGAAVLGIGIWLTYNGGEPIGSQLIGVGSTILGSGIVGLVLARVTATLSGKTQEEIEARREHKRKIDELLEHLMAEGKTVSIADGGGMNFLVGYLHVERPFLRNLGSISNQTQNQLLWDDLQNHWPDEKSRADHCLGKVNEHNRKIRDFVNQWDEQLRRKAAVFSGKFEGSSKPESTVLESRVTNDCFYFASGRLAGYASYILSREAVKKESRVDPGELTTMSLPLALESTFAAAETFAAKPGEAPEGFRELIPLGKERAIQRFRELQASFLEKTIADSADELKLDSSLAKLLESKARLDSEAKDVEVGLYEIEASKSLPGSCRYVRIA